MKFFKNLGLMICILFLPLAAFAQDNQEELKAIEITATRTSIEEENPASALTVITQEEIQQKQHLQVKDILREQLGINVVTVGPLGGISTVFMRGAGSESTLVMIDGVQVNANTTGGYNFSNLQMDNIERIEILRGPQSTLWGADAAARSQEIQPQGDQQGQRHRDQHRRVDRARQCVPVVLRLIVVFDLLDDRSVLVVARERDHALIVRARKRRRIPPS